MFELILADLTSMGFYVKRVLKSVYIEQEFDHPKVTLCVWRDVEIPLLTNCVRLVLPCPQPGWEERTHADGRVFYIDHSK